jgi:hypothetical protein
MLKRLSKTAKFQLLKDGNNFTDKVKLGGLQYKPQKRK